MKRLWFVTCATAVLVVFAVLPPSRSDADIGNGAWSKWLVFTGSDDAPTAPMVAAAAPNRPKTSEVTVTYAGFPEPPRLALEHAAAILEQLVTSDFEVYVSASWVPLGSGPLATVRTRFYSRDSADNARLPHANALYPAALAGMFRGERIDGLPDIEIEVNSEYSWYTGTDGRPPADRWDLVTVALHEMLQAYGIWSETNPFADDPATIYDTFVHGPGDSPVYQHDATTRYIELTGGQLTFAGPAARVAAGGEAPRLYSPAQFDPASSASHLHEYYADADPDAILAPYLFPGWAFHEPGPITLAMLKDIGWAISGLGTATRLTIRSHEPSLVQLDEPFPVAVEVVTQDPVGVAVASAGNLIVELEAVGWWTGNASWTCLGGIHQALSGGRAVFSGCEAAGPWISAYLEATSPGLASGMHHVFLLVDDLYRSYVPGLGQSR
jgi:hypothetical protein